MRIILGVITAFVIMMATVYLLSIAPWYWLGLDTVLRPGLYETTGAYNTYAIAVALLGAVFGGWLCAKIGRSWRAVIVLMMLAFTGGTANVILHLAKSTPGARPPDATVNEVVVARKEPLWFTLVMPCFGVPAILLGARFAQSIPEFVQEYVTSIQIAATPQRVWSILTNAADYSKWNPEIVRIDGQMGLNERIIAHVKLGSGAIRKVPLVVTAFHPSMCMEWTGGMPWGLFVGRRTLTVVPRDGGAEFQMHLRMSGPMAPLILKSVGDRQPEIDLFSAAVKSYAEFNPASLSS